MKIGIIGSGIVAQTLGSGFIKHGHEVTLGTRSPEKLAEWRSNNSKSALVASFEETAKYGDIIVLAVQGKSAESALSLAGADNLSGKTILDTTNPISDKPPINGVLNFFTDQNSSLLEHLQAKFPEANFVKAFSSVGAGFMVNPDFGGIKPTMFIAGNNDDAKKQTKEILDAFGWETEDMGAAEAGRAIEPLCMLWCIPGFRENRWTHAFKLLK
ncbi:MAG: NAD(P)-binding domain-containing protein [Ignavibacteriae bacterium]|nr:NAD(P)-binding domain-containing protein [Ignavibacteriota bacterium]